MVHFPGNTRKALVNGLRLDGLFAYGKRVKNSKLNYLACLKMWKGKARIKQGWIDFSGFFFFPFSFLKAKYFLM